MFINVNRREGLIYFEDKLHDIIVDAAMEGFTERDIDSILLVKAQELKNITRGLNRFVKMGWTPRDFIMYAYSFDENGRAVRCDIYTKVWDDQRIVMRNVKKHYSWLYEEEIHGTEQISEFKSEYLYTKELAKVCRCEHYKAYQSMIHDIETRAKELKYI